MTAMPLKVGTLSHNRTQLNLKCHRCRHEWSIEMAPPVLIVRPARHTDDDETGGSRPPIAEAGLTHDKRNAYQLKSRRMRAGLCGLLRSPDKTQTAAVLYSLDARQATGRLRPLDPANVFAPWLVAGSRLWLSAYDGSPLRIRINIVKPPRKDSEDGEQFAEFVVAQAAAPSTARGIPPNPRAVEHIDTR